ncbi:hypothetical protein ACFL50_05870 [Candidatus Latescibacterota bacterium]
MNISKIIVILYLSLTAFSGCDKNPTEPELLSTILVKFTNNNENLSVDSFVSQRIYGPSNNGLAFYKYYNFDDTTTVIDSVPQGNYTVTRRFKFRDTRSKHLMEISFINDVTVEPNQTIETHFILPSDIQLKIFVEKSGNIPIEGAEISTNPETLTLISDVNGIADFGYIPVTNYLFTVKKNNITVFSKYETIIIRNGIYGEVIIHVSSDLV